MPKFLKLTSGEDVRSAYWVNASAITHMFREGSKTYVCFGFEDGAHLEVTERPERIIELTGDTNA